MKVLFPVAFDLTLHWEGGSKLTNDPDDPGGLTKYGISQKAYPDLDIENLTEAQAKAIYQRDYWNAVRGDDLPAGADILAYDTAVNLGVTQASRLLQRAANHFGNSLRVDGQIGPVTLNAVHNADFPEFLISYAQERIEFYVSLAEKNERMAKFLKGWLRRNCDVSVKAALLAAKHG